MTEQAEATATPIARRWRLSAKAVRLGIALVGGVILLGTTTYLAVDAILWHSQVADLERTRMDLTAQLAAQRSEHAAGENELSLIQVDLDEHVATLIDLTNDKAQAEDQKVIFADIASALSDCSSAMGETMQVYYTLTSGNFYLDDSVGFWQLHAELSSYCEDVSAALTDQIAQEKEGA